MCVRPSWRTTHVVQARNRFAADSNSTIATDSVAEVSFANGQKFCVTSRRRYLRNRAG